MLKASPERGRFFIEGTEARRHDVRERGGMGKWGSIQGFCAICQGGGGVLEAKGAGITKRPFARARTHAIIGAYLNSFVASQTLTRSLSELETQAGVPGDSPGRDGVPGWLFRGFDGAAWRRAFLAEHHQLDWREKPGAEDGLGRFVVGNGVNRSVMVH